MSAENSERPRLSWSEIIGRPPFVLDPEQIPNAWPFPHKDWVRFTTDGLVVKCGSTTSLREAEAMHYVAKNTKLETPEIVAAYTLDDITYIVMNRVDGKYISEFWWDASANDRAKVVETLREGFASMRALSADYIGGFNRTGCKAAEFDWDFNHPRRPYGPYDNDAAFHDGLFEALARSYPTPLPTDGSLAPDHWSQHYRDIIDSLKGHKTVMTHGDLNHSNIIVRDDLSVVVLDWGTAGFFPEYWEWYKVVWLHQETQKLAHAYEQFVPPFKAEAATMAELYKRILR